MKKSMESWFLKPISLEWGEFGEETKYFKLASELLNSLIFAGMGPFAVTDLESDSSLFQALRRSL